MKDNTPKRPNFGSFFNGYRDGMWSPINWQQSETSNWYSSLILKFYWLNFGYCCKSTSMDYLAKSRAKFFVQILYFLF